MMAGLTESEAETARRAEKVRLAREYIDGIVRLERAKRAVSEAEQQVQEIMREQARRCGAFAKFVGMNKPELAIDSGIWNDRDGTRTFVLVQARDVGGPAVSVYHAEMEK